MYYILLVCIIVIIVVLILYNKEHFNNNIKINKTYVINLDKRKDRLKSIDKDLKKIKLEYERFPACDGENLENIQMISLKYLIKTIS